MRFAYRYIPQGSSPLERPGVNAVVYLKDRYALGYRGNASKPAFNYRFKDAEAAARYAGEFLEKEEKCQAEAAQRKAAKKAERAAFKTSLKPGDILSGSWGYDQTNVEFFEVLEVKPSGKSVAGSEGFMSDSVVPAPGAYAEGSKPMLKIVQPGYKGADQVKLKSYCYLSKYQGGQKYRSWYA